MGYVGIYSDGGAFTGSIPQVNDINTTYNFYSLPNSYNLSNPTEAAKLALNEKYGEDSKF